MQKNSPLPKTYLAPGEVAEMLMVSPTTVRLWASRGDLKSVSTPGGHRRFMCHEIERFAREKQLTIQMPNDDTLRILIVDDDTHVATFLVRFFDCLESDIATMEAHDGYTAGRLVHTFKPHIVLLDLMMPGLNGFDVCSKIKSDPATKACRVIAMTGFFDDKNVQQALDAGAECCIAKPFDEDQLLTLLGVKRARAIVPNAETEPVYRRD